MLQLAGSVGLHAHLPNAAAQVNADHYDLIERHVVAHNPRCVAVLGLSFKLGVPVTITSPAFELIARLRKHGIDIVCFDPDPEVRNQAHAKFGNQIECFDALDATFARSNTFLICNPDQAFTDFSKRVSTNARIVDPWGCVQDPHPGLVRLGRIPYDSRSTRQLCPQGQRPPK